MGLAGPLGSTCDLKHNFRKGNELLKTGGGTFAVKRSYSGTGGAWREADLSNLEDYEKTIIHLNAAKAAEATAAEPEKTAEAVTA